MRADWILLSCYQRPHYAAFWDRLNPSTEPKVTGSNPVGCNDLRSHQRPLAHALPRFPVEDPNLAMIVGLWNRLTDQIKRRIIEVVRANLPTESSKTTSNSER